ncbi:MAG: FUSC family protein [Clostridium sp.]
MEISKLPKVGLRTIKTSIAVFLCLVLLPNEPFFACLTSVFCIQDTVENSFKMGKNRGVGTLLGASIGLVVMLSFKFITKDISSGFFSKLLIYLCISLGIILVIYLNNLFLNMPGAIPVSCIAFLGVTTTHAFGHPFVYAFNRTFETLCGIVIGILVNKIIHPPKSK